MASDIDFTLDTEGFTWAVTLKNIMGIKTFIWRWSSTLLQNRLHIRRRGLHLSRRSLCLKWSQFQEDGAPSSSVSFYADYIFEAFIQVTGNTYHLSCLSQNIFIFTFFHHESHWFPFGTKFSEHRHIYISLMKQHIE